MLLFIFISTVQFTNIIYSYGTLKAHNYSKLIMVNVHREL